MTKFKTIIIALFLIPLLSSAQKNELLLGLSAGVNIPMGDFASTDYTINEEGVFESNGQFAKLGSAFDFSANYRVGYYLGFSGRIMGGTNKVDTEKYSEALNTILNDEGLDVTTASKGWGSMGLFLGGYFVVPVYDFYLDLRLMAGYANLFSPSIRYYFSDENGESVSNEPYIKEKYSAGGFAYDVGLGIKYKFSGNKFILLNADYIGSHIIKDNILTLDPISKEEILVNMDVDYQNVTVTLGLGYIF